jgi:hypothetical protein
MTEFELYDRITEAGLSPNEYFALAFVVYGFKKKTEFNLDVAMRQLRSKEFLDKRNIPTEKCVQYGLFRNLKLLTPKKEPEDLEFEEKVKWYIQMFPPIRLPSGMMARQDLKLVKAKFRKFFEQYKYDWNTIFEATESYINYYAQQKYKFMRNSVYFILKDGKSDLALECDTVINSSKVSARNSFDQDI